MAEIYMTLNGVSCKDVGLACKTHRPVLPPLLPSLEEISGMNGSYDYGNNVYQDRTIDVDFYVHADNFRNFRLDVRKVAQWLSRKGKIVFSDEPEKYYIGRIYVSPMLDQNVISTGRFSASFVCEPFAYGENATISDSGSLNLDVPLEYAGTHPACCRIIIRNTGTTPIVNPILTHFITNT